MSSTPIYCLYTDFEGDQTQPYTTLLGCKVHSLQHVPENMIAKSFGGGSYLKTSVRGDIMKGVVINKWVEIWGMDLDRAFTVDLEIYGKKAKNPTDAEGGRQTARTRKIFNKMFVIFNHKTQ